MGKSLLEQLPAIVAEGKREAERILDRLDSASKVSLQTRELVVPSKDTSWSDMLLQAERGTHSSELDPSKMNRLIYGDNLLAMAALLAGDEHTPSMRGKVDLIYIDPPFDSKADYRTKVELPGTDIEQKPTTIEQFAYADTWKDGTASYLETMIPRALLLREMLSDVGSIFIHLDWHVGHYAKIVFDEIFGRDNFRNEIVWQRSSAHNDSKRTTSYGTIHDTIFWYTKSVDKYIWNTQFSPYSADYIKKSYTKVDEKTGKRFKTSDITANNPGYFYSWRGVEPSKGRYWAYSESRMQQLENENRLYHSSSGMPYYKNFEDEMQGIVLQDLWTDISISSGNERVNYATQKPEKLISRIIGGHTTPNSIVADFYTGSGTTASVAEKKSLRWIACDLGKPACMITRKRLIDQNAKPFLYQHVGDYQVEQAKSTLGRKFKVGDLANVVLGLYGALPLPPENNPTRNLGRIPQGKILVFCDSPTKVTGYATLKRAVQMRDSLMGGFDKVVVLGWNFASSIGQDLQGMNEGERLEVLVIPPDLLDRLKKKGNKLKSDEIKFSSLQYLALGPTKREKSGTTETLQVELANYVLLSPDAISLDEANRAKLQKVMDKEPLALVEYWSVDPDYDGEVFRSVWQDYRGNTDNDGDAYRVVTKALLNDLPAKDGPRKVCVRAVDVFGFEAEAIVEVA